MVRRSSAGQADTNMQHTGSSAPELEATAADSSDVASSEHKESVNWTILAIYGPRNRLEPFWQFLAPEIANSWQFMVPETAPFW